MTRLESSASPKPHTSAWNSTPDVPTDDPARLRDPRQSSRAGTLHADNSVGAATDSSISALHINSHTAVQEPDDDSGAGEDNFPYRVPRCGASGALTPPRRCRGGHRQWEHNGYAPRCCSPVRRSVARDDLRGWADALLQEDVARQVEAENREMMARMLKRG